MNDEENCFSMIRLLITITSASKYFRVEKFFPLFNCYYAFLLFSHQQTNVAIIPLQHTACMIICFVFVCEPLFLQITLLQDTYQCKSPHTFKLESSESHFYITSQGQDGDFPLERTKRKNYFRLNSSFLFFLSSPVSPNRVANK